MEGAPVDVCRYRTNAKRVLIAAAQPARPVARAHSRVAGDAAGRRRNLSSSPPETCARRTPHDALGRTERVYVAIGAKVLQHGVVKFLHRLELYWCRASFFLARQRCNHGTCFYTRWPDECRVRPNYD
jgi:hypothetical protein